MKNFNLKTLSFIFCMAIASIAYAYTYYNELTTTLTVQNGVYSPAVNGTLSQTSSVFIVLVKIKHPQQGNLKPRLFVNNAPATLAAISNDPDGGLRFMYYKEAQPQPAAARLELKSNSGGSITITPSTSQKVELTMYGCSTIPTVLGGGC